MHLRQVLERDNRMRHHTGDGGRASLPTMFVSTNYTYLIPCGRRSRYENGEVETGNNQVHTVTIVDC